MKRGVSPNEALGLENLPMFRLSDPETSQMAASDVLPNSQTDRERVLECLQSHPLGLTDFELAEKLGGQQTSLGKRRCELMKLGQVEDSGLRRPSPSGSAAIVWKLV